MDKEELRQAFADWATEMGVVIDENDTTTPQQVREMMLAEGVRPEDNILSRALLRMRYPD